jgi:hypothetical protein
MPKGGGRGRRRRSRLSLGSPWGSLGVRPWSGSFSAPGATSRPWTGQGIDPPRSGPRWRRSARRATPAGSAALTRARGGMPQPGGWPPSRGSSRAVGRPSLGISPGPSRPSGTAHGTAASPGWRRSPRLGDGAGRPAVATPSHAGGRESRRGTSRRGGRGRGPSASGGGRQRPGANCAPRHLRPSRRRTMPRGGRLPCHRSEPHACGARPRRLGARPSRPSWRGASPSIRACPARMTRSTPCAGCSAHATGPRVTPGSRRGRAPGGRRGGPLSRGCARRRAPGAPGCH